MTSQEAIKNSLIQIGEQNGYSGEMVEIAADLLSYVLYQNQIEVANVSQESSLTTAKLMNSKIKLCMESMYSVYRGYNARVLLNFKSNTIINKSKFDLVYESNTFKLYSAKNYSIVPEDYNTNREPMECLFVTGAKNETEIEINESNKYYIDLMDSDGHLLTNLSEDIKVTIDGIEYPTTRNFYDHINTPIPTDPNSENLDKIFVLTTMDNGIRLYKRGYFDSTLNKNIGYFKVGSIVKVETFKYTKFEDINPDEYNKITLPATELYPIDGLTIYYNDNLCTMKGILGDVSELPNSAQIGDTYTINRGLYSYLNTTIPNPSYIPDDKNPEEFKISKFVPLSGIDTVEFSNLLVTLKDEYKVSDLTFKGNLVSTSLLPMNNADIGDVYFINSIPYVFLNMGEPDDDVRNYGFYTLINLSPSYNILNSVLFSLWKDYGLLVLSNKGIIGSIGVLPYSGNSIGDTYILVTHNRELINYSILIYRDVIVSNPDYIDPDDNPEFKDETSFIKIGSMDDYESINGMSGRKYIEEIPKETESSILYNANHSTRTQSSILSNSDVGYLFTEYFINEVLESNTRLCPKGIQQGSINVGIPDENTVYIFYIPRTENVEVPNSKIIPFINQYNAYFVSNNIETYSSQLAIIDVSIDLYLDSNTQIMEDLTAIFDQYSYKLTKRSAYTESDMGKRIDNTLLEWDYDYYDQLIDEKSIYSKISKISYVNFINNFKFLELNYGTVSEGKLTDLTRIPTSYEKSFIDSDGNQIFKRVPIYYKFNLSVNYKNNYEIIS